MILMYVENTEMKISQLLNKNYVVPNYVTNKFKLLHNKIKSVAQEGVEEKVVIYIVLFGTAGVAVKGLEDFFQRQLKSIVSTYNTDIVTMVSTSAMEYIEDSKIRQKYATENYFSTFEYDPIEELDSELREILISCENVDLGLDFELKAESDNTESTKLLNEYIQKFNFIKTDFVYDKEAGSFRITLDKYKGEEENKNEINYPDQFITTHAAVEDVTEEMEKGNEVGDIDFGKKVVINIKKGNEQVHYRGKTTVENTFEDEDEDEEYLNDKYINIDSLLRRIENADRKMTRKQRRIAKKETARRLKNQKANRVKARTNKVKDRVLKELEEGYSDTVKEILDKVK
jgi:hypothetical protein